MKFKKPKFWDDINFLSICLLPLTLITFVFNFIKSHVITKHRFKIPIICVGNIYIGGTGKTPLSIFIYNLLKKKRFKPAIIRKYYNSHLDEISLTKNKISNFFLNKKRFISINQAEEEKSNVIIMDDGLQDVSIVKDLKIICFNSEDLIGNGLLIPAGPLRDQLTKLQNCEIAVINGKRNVTFEKKIKIISKDIKIFQSKYEIKDFKKFKRKKLLAFAGIGNPENFFKLLKEYGLKIQDKVSYPDHYNYTKIDMEKLIRRAKNKDLKLITTEKDYLRIKHLGLRKVDYVSVNLKIAKYKEFEKEILKYI